MTSDQEKLSRFTPKQKVMAIVIVVVLLVVVWQVMGLFGGGSEPTVMQQSSATAKTAATTTTTTTRPQQSMTAQAPNTTPQNTTTPQPNPNPNPPQQPPAGANANAAPAASTQQQMLMAQQQDTQKQYVDTINQLQMLKLQKDIEETKQSITAARLATATAEKRISDLFVRPAPDAQASPTDASKAPAAPGTSPVPSAIEGGPDAQYTTISVSMRLGHWMAVLGNQGKLYNVSVGDILPLDGSEVVAIGKSGVILKKNDIKRKVSVVNAI